MVAFRFLGIILVTNILSYFFVSASKYHVPVIIWGSGLTDSKDDAFSSLARVSTDDFFSHFLKKIHKLSEKPTVVLFIEETFSLEDFSLQNGQDSSFPLLKRIVGESNLEFLPSVENPVSAFSGSELKSYGFNIAEITGDEIKSNSGQNIIYLVNLEDADSKEDRPHMLNRHDQRIANLYDALKKYKNVIYILTGRFASWTGSEEILRVRRQANDSSPNANTSAPTTKPALARASSGIVLEAENSMIYSKKPPILKIGGVQTPLTSPTDVFADTREKLQKAIFTFNVAELGKVNLRFQFENISNYYWGLSVIVLELQNSHEIKLLTTKQHISAQYDYSFHTSTPVVFSNGSTSLTFSDLQVQPWKMSEFNKRFGEAEDDTVFFTPPIWTGLIVSGLISVILLWALGMIMDIHTMDQFDDPKGKTITVNVTD
ncbi:V-type proton ATPase subunit S1-like [Lycorma delicatula]|uniref:V-type proton ATPase subunit S1-like n=1 Tax=Lycorma delicatula TaxID=130591 RepID=UPI003F5169E9